MKQTSSTSLHASPAEPTPSLRRVAMAVLLAALFVGAAPMAAADGETTESEPDHSDGGSSVEPCYVSMDPDQSPYVYVDC